MDRTIDALRPNGSAPILHEVEAALSAEHSQQPPLPEQDANRKLEGKISKLTSSLRRAAMVVLVTAAGSSLFQGWASWDSAQRIMAFVAFIASLAITGLLCAFKFKDTKGARVGLGLAAAVVPVAFSQTGGLIYSVFGDPSHTVPSMLRYTSTSSLTTGIVVAAVLLLLPPIAYAGFSVLARSEAKLLTALYVLGNSALLIPTRDSGAIGMISMAVLSLLLTADIARFHLKPELRTLEGAMSRLMLFVPFAVMVIRSLALYDISSVLIGCLFSVLTAFLFVVLPNLIDNNDLQKAAQTLSTLSMAAAWYCFSQALFFGREAVMPLSPDFLYPIRALPVAAGLVAMSFFTVGRAARYRHSAAYLATLTMILQLVAVPGLVTSFFCILTSILCIAAGCILEEKGFFLAGCWGLVLGVLYHLRYAVRLYAGLDPWISLAVLGIVTLISASYLERNYRPLAARIRAFHERVKGWE